MPEHQLNVTMLHFQYNTLILMISHVRNWPLNSKGIATFTGKVNRRQCQCWPVLPCVATVKVLEIWFTNKVKLGLECLSDSSKFLDAYDQFTELSLSTTIL